MGLHSEKCRKYKQQIENLTMDLEDLQEKYNEMEARNERQREKIKKFENEAKQQGRN